DTEQRPLDPVHPGHARRLLSRGRAAVWRRAPFTLILKCVVPNATPAPLRLKIDPGSRTTGLALVTDPGAMPDPSEPIPTDAEGGIPLPLETTGRVVWAGELIHRGDAVHEGLVTRTAVRRSRRQRHTRYRPSRCANRRRTEGWLPPSLESRLANVETWIRRLCQLANVVALAQELVRFDTQALVNPEISGVEYQQGTLAGYELREYLLEKWQRRCAYCHATGIPLQIEHIVPRTRHGSDRASNLTLACEPCNQKKGTLTAEEFGHPQVQAQAQLPLRDAAAVNASRWALFHRLRATGLPVETGTGGRTKWNRTRRGLPKAHWTDAACVGVSTPDHLVTDGVYPLVITATGHGNRRMCGTDKHGFPIRHRTHHKRFFDFQTGDLVRAQVPAGLATAGTHIGRVLVRASGSFDVAMARGRAGQAGRRDRGRVAGISARYMRMLARGDGYAYSSYGAGGGD
ncbi:MAG TPA: RNA-guided endonuclease IscB, partial [Ktedonobacterales bacterium]|nr:RNA-guided endonuclease IscB [Ktedonobacterales bacterium]